MRIQSIDNSKQSPTMKAGLYFIKKSNVLFNRDPNIKFITKDFVKVSKDGFRYIEDNLIPQSIKDRFAKNSFVKDLSEKFDTFIFYRELPKGHKNNFGCENIAFAKISWADFTQSHAQMREVNGHSPISEDLAIDKMFKELEKCKFCAIS